MGLAGGLELQLPLLLRLSQHGMHKQQQADAVAGLQIPGSQFNNFMQFCIKCSGLLHGRVLAAVDMRCCYCFGMRKRVVAD